MPDVTEVFVEIPKGSRNKYEWDHTKGRFKLDRMLFSAVQYPGDYGFVPGTWAEDDDPVDALIILSDPTFPGCTIDARVVGIFYMSDEKGPDAKILGVPDADPRWAHVQGLDDVPDHLLSEISHFFAMYKELESKAVTVRGFGDRQEAFDEIERDRKRYEQLPEDERPAMP